MPKDAGPQFALDAHPFFWMTQVISARDKALGAELKGLGLRVPEWRVLAALYSRRRLSISELSDLASIDRTTLSRTVDRMEKTGSVTRLTDTDDLRITRLALTGAGERMFARIWPTVERLNRAAIAGLPNGSLELLNWTLGQMKTNLDPQLLPGSAAQRAA
jgi:MarR family transcriptional regulator, organic hydroperoxide resistance regulator